MNNFFFNFVDYINSNTIIAFSHSAEFMGVCRGFYVASDFFLPVRKRCSMTISMNFRGFLLVYEYYNKGITHKLIKLTLTEKFQFSHHSINYNAEKTIFSSKIGLRMTKQS